LFNKILESLIKPTLTHWMT